MRNVREVTSGVILTKKAMTRKIITYIKYVHVLLTYSVTAAI
jgi:hypothetical protein